MNLTIIIWLTPKWKPRECLTIHSFESEPVSSITLRGFPVWSVKVHDQCTLLSFWRSKSSGNSEDHQQLLLKMELKSDHTINRQRRKSNVWNNIHIHNSALSTLSAEKLPPKQMSAWQANVCIGGLHDIQNVSLPAGWNPHQGEFQKEVISPKACQCPLDHPGY